MFKKILQGLVLVSAFAALGSAMAAPVGYVHEVKGNVTLRDAGKPAPVPAKVGDVFEQGAAFVTGADGQVTLKFEDGQIALLTPNTQFVATSYIFDKTDNTKSNVLFSVARGGMRFISGLIATKNSEKFAIKTPTATAGVRGTDGTMALDATGNMTLTVKEGVVTLTVGGQSVTVNAGQVTFSSNGGTPSAPVALTSLPPGQAATLLALLAIANAAAAAPTPPPTVIPPGQLQGPTLTPDAINQVVVPPTTPSLK